MRRHLTRSARRQARAISATVCRNHSTNVKRWRDGQMALRWCAAGMTEATTQFRRVNGHLHLPKVRAALERHFQENVTPVGHNQTNNAA